MSVMVLFLHNEAALTSALHRYFQMYCILEVAEVMMKRAFVVGLVLDQSCGNP